MTPNSTPPSFLFDILVAGEINPLGDGRPFVACLLVPNLATLEARARAERWEHTRPADLFQRAEARALFQREIDRVNADLAPFERVKRFALLDRELSQEGGELTPTLKVRRRVVAAKFAPLIEQLYAAEDTGRARPAPTA